MDRRLVLPPLEQPLAGFPRRDAVDVGELRDCVADAFVDRALGDLSTVEMHHRHPREDCRHHHPGQFPAVTKHDEGASPRQRPRDPE